MPNEYRDFDLSGKENAEKYLQMCADNNRRPKFYKLLVNNGDGSYSLQPDGSTDGYWKLLIDFKMYNHLTGEGAPQNPVRPEFNMEASQRMLNDYKGGHQSFPVANDIVDRFVNEYGNRGKAKLSGGKYTLNPDLQFKVKAGHLDNASGSEYNTLEADSRIGTFDANTPNIKYSAISPERKAQHLEVTGAMKGRQAQLKGEEKGRQAREEAEAKAADTIANAKETGKAIVEVAKDKAKEKGDRYIRNGQVVGRMLERQGQQKLKEERKQIQAREEAKAEEKFARKYRKMVKEFDDQFKQAEDRKNESIDLWNKVRKTSFPEINDPSDAVDAYSALKAARRDYERSSAKNGLTDREKDAVGKLLRGEYLAERLFEVPDIRYLKVLHVATAAYQYMQLGKLISEYRSKVRAERNKTALGAIGDKFLKFRDIPMGAFGQLQTPERVMEYIAGNDYDAADKLKELYVKPIIKANGDETRLKEATRDRVRKMEINQKVEKGNKVSEDYAVQYLGETLSEIDSLEKKTSEWEKKHGDKLTDINERLTSGKGKTGRLLTAKQIEELKGRLAKENDKTTPEYKSEGGQTLGELREAVEQFKKDNPNLNYNRIENDLIPQFRQIYNTLFEEMNEVRVRNGYEPVDYRKGYFPHYSRDDTSALVRFANSLGINFDTNLLPTTIQGLTHEFKPGITWFGHALRREGNKTDYGVTEGIDRYIEGVSKVIARTDAIQNMRALANTIRRLADPSWAQIIDKVYSDRSLSEEAKYEAIENEYRNRLQSEDEKSQKTALANFVTWLDENTNTYAGKATYLDRWVRNNFQNRATKGIAKLLSPLSNLPRGIVTRYGANTVSVNPGSWLTNFAPIFEAAAEINPIYVAKAITTMKDEIKRGDEFRDASNFITARFDSEPLTKESRAKELVKKLASPMEWIDGITSYVVTHSRYLENLGRGMSESAALDEADMWAGRLMADRGAGRLPIVMQYKNPIVKMFTQFQTEALNSLEHNTHDVMYRLKREHKSVLIHYAGFVLRKAILMWILNELYEALVGRRFMPDPIDWANEFYGDVTGTQFPNTVNMGVNKALYNVSGGKIGRLPTAYDFEVKKEGVPKAIANLGKNAAEELPIIGSAIGGGRIPVQQSYKSLAKLPPALGMLMDEDEKNNQEAYNRLWKSIEDPLTYLVLPGAGSEIKRIVEAARQMSRGGSYDEKGNLRYPFYSENGFEAAGNFAKIALFGSTSTDAGQKWVDSGFDSFKARATAAYESMVNLDVPQRQAYEIADKFRDVEKTEDNSEAYEQRQYIRGLDISGKAKAALYECMMLDEDSRDGRVIDELDIMGADMDEAINNIFDIKDINSKSYTGDNKSRDIRNVIRNSKLDGDDRLLLYTDLALTASSQKEIDLLNGLNETCDGGDLVDTAMDLKESGKTIDDTRVLLDSKLPASAKQDMYLGLCVDGEDNKEKKLKQINDIKASGIDFNGYLKIANKHKELGLDDDKAGTNAIQFSYWIDKQGYTAKQKAAIQDAFGYYYQSRADDSKYSKLTATGMSADQAYKMVDQLGALQPEDGASQVKDYQKAKVVASQKNMSEEEKLSALRSVYSTDSNTNYSKAYVAYEYGVPLDTYFDFVEAAMKAKDDPRNEGVKEAAIVEAVLNKTNLTNKQKAAIWQCYSVNWAVKNNPYDSNVGASVRSQYYESDGKTRKETMPGGLSYGKSTSASGAAASAPPSNGVLPAVQGNNALSQALSARSGG